MAAMLPKQLPLQKCHCTGSEATGLVLRPVPGGLIVGAPGSELYCWVAVRFVMVEGGQGEGGTEGGPGLGGRQRQWQTAPFLVGKANIGLPSSMSAK